MASERTSICQVSFIACLEGARGLGRAKGGREAWQVGEWGGEEEGGTKAYHRGGLGIILGKFVLVFKVAAEMRILLCWAKLLPRQICSALPICFA